MKNNPEAFQSSSSKEPKKVSGKQHSSFNPKILTEKRESLKQSEKDQEKIDFLYSKQIIPNVGNLQKLTDYLSKTQEHFLDFSLQDISDEELSPLFDSNIRIKTKKETRKKNNIQLTQAKSAEILVDDLQKEGLSKTQVIRELLEAHDNDQVKLLPEKYARYHSLLQLLDQKAFGNETVKVEQVINQSNIDLGEPKAFEQILSIVLEDDSISDETKKILHEKFGLKQIILGSDLKDNLLKVRDYNQKLQKERLKLIEKIDDFEKQITVIKKEMKRFKEEILAEKEGEKKAQLEKDYDALEEHLISLLHQKAETQIAGKELKDKKRSETLFIQGCEARIMEEEIIVKIPDSIPTIKFPLESGTEYIAECINVFLLYQLFQPLGIAKAFFGSLDLTGRLIPLPNAIKRANRFSIFFKQPNIAYIFSQKKLSKLSTMMSRLIKPDEFNPKLSDQENGTKRLKELKLYPIDRITMDRLMRKLWWEKILT